MKNAYVSFPKSLLDDVKAAVAKLNRKATKLGCSHASIILGRDYDKEIWKEYTVDGPFRAETVYAKTPTIVRFIDVMMTYPEVRLNGWHFVAKVTHTKHGNFFQGFCDEGIPEEYRTAESYCDHCASKRKRNATFLVKNGNEWKQVGSTCLKDFCGIGAAQILNHASAYSFLVDLRDHDWEAGGWCGTAFLPVKHALEYLTYAAHSIRLNGYRKRDDTASTIFHVAWLMDGPGPKAPLSEIDRWEEARAAIETRDALKAMAVIEWIWTQPSSSDYMHNLHIILKNDDVEPRMAGVLASSVTSYDKWVGVTEKVAQGASEWVGKVGEKFKGVLTVSRIHRFDTNYGPCAFCQFLDENGNILIWKTGNYGTLPDPGYRVRLAGTIKEHREYMGSRQTLITRCRPI